ncbi:MAG: VWA domain-containing protein [Alphaproteobacteria bacterium]|nr:VWA domain-containing protein [Alphaproteobacteria bacterium]
MFTFHWPWLCLLLPLPLIVRLLLPKSKKSEMKTTPELRFPDLSPLQKAFSGHQKKSRPSDLLFLIILSLSWIFLVLAVMRPQFVDQYSQIQNEGYDLMVAVDISGSMQALDFSTKEKMVSRLDVTKEVVGKFVRERQGDRIGLILFGENAFLQVPLTLDTSSVDYMLNNAVPGLAGFGTAIGDAIGLGVRNLRERPEGSRVIVLLTDGMDTASSIPPLESAKLAKQYGIRIYAIGVGKNGPVPFLDDRGRIQMVKVPMDEELLKEVATRTNGKYFQATDQFALQDIYEKINQLEKTKSNVRTYLIQKPLYRYPLGIAVALFLILSLLPFYRRITYGI